MKTSRKLQVLQDAKSRQNCENVEIARTFDWTALKNSKQLNILCTNMNHDIHATAIVMMYIIIA